MDRKSFGIVALGVLGGVLLWLFFRNQNPTPVGFAPTGGNAFANPGGVSGGAAAAAGIGGALASFGRLFTGSPAPGTTGSGTAAQGLATAGAVNTSAGFLTEPSPASTYGVAQALASQSAGAATPVFLPNSNYATEVGPQLPFGAGAPIISPAAGAGSIDLSFLSPSLSGAPVPPPVFAQANGSGVNGSTSSFGTSIDTGFDYSDLSAFLS